MHPIYTLYDFMEYPNFAFKLAMIVPFSWSGARQHSSDKFLFFKRLWYIFGATNLIYQNFGMLIYLFVPHASKEPTMTTDVQAIMSTVSETGGVMGLTLVGACKMFILFWYADNISALLEEFETIFPSVENLRKSKRRWGVPGHYRMHHFAQQSRIIMKYTTIFFIFAFFYYNILPIVEFIYETLNYDKQWKYRYQSNTWYPWQTKNNSKSVISFMFAYLCQVQSSLTGVAFIMAGEFMLCFFITQMQMHFDFLANALESLDARDADANNRLKYLIDYHNRLLCFSKEINHIFNISFMVNFVTSSIAICLMGISMVSIDMAHAFKYSVGLLSFLIFTLFICYNGSEFSSSSDKLMPAAFYSNWYEGNLSYRKMILFFIMRSKLPNELQAYKFATVSMETYMMILKSSYQLFTFIRAMG